MHKVKTVVKPATHTSKLLFFSILLAVVSIFMISITGVRSEIRIVNTDDKTYVYHNGKKINESPLIKSKRVEIEIEHNRMLQFMLPAYSEDTVSVLKKNEIVDEKVDSLSMQDRVGMIGDMFNLEYRVNGSIVGFNDISSRYKTELIGDFDQNSEIKITGSNIPTINISFSEDTKIYLRPEWHHENMIKVGDKVYGDQDIGLEMLPLGMKMIQNIMIVSFGLSVFIGITLILIEVVEIIRLGALFVARYTGLHVVKRLIQKSLIRYVKPSLMVQSLVIILFLLVAAYQMFVLNFTLRNVLEAFPHTQDEIVYLFQAKLIGGLRFFVPPVAGDARYFFDHEFLVNDGKWFGMYTIGTSLFLALGRLFGFVECVIPTLYVVIIFITDYVMWKQKLPLWSILLVNIFFALAPSQTLIATSYMSHIPASFATIIVFAAGVLGSPLAAGIGIGTLLLIRPYNAVFVGLWYLIFGLAVWIISEKRVKSKKKVFTILLEYARAHVMVGMTVAPFALFQLWNNYVLSGDIMTFPQSVYSEYNKIGFGVRGIEFGIDFTYVKAFELTLFNMLSFFDMFQATPYFFSMTFVLLGVASIFIATKYRKIAIASLSIILVQIVAYFPFHGNGTFFGPRYWSEVYFAFMILSALGVFAICDFFSRNISKTIYVVMTIIMMGYMLYGNLRLNGILAQFVEYNGMSPRFLGKLPKFTKPTIILIHAKESWQQYGRYFVDQDPFFGSKVIYARLDARHNIGRRDKVFDKPNEILLKAFPGRDVYVINALGELESY